MARVILNWMMVAGVVLSMGFGGIVQFTLFFILAALTAPVRSSVLGMACILDCDTVDDVGDNSSCNTRGGIKTIYYEKFDFFDWAAVEADIAAGAPYNYFDPTNNCWTAPPPLVTGGSLLKKMTFDRKNAFYEFTYTEDAGVYEQAIDINFEGKSKTNVLAFSKLVSCCDLIMLIYDNNCQARLVGPEWDGTTFERQVKTLRVGTHTDRSGQFGQSLAGDQVIFVGESTLPPGVWEVDETAIPV